MMLGKLPVPGYPTNLDLDIFSPICRFSLLSPSLRETARYRLKYCPKGPLSQPTPLLQIYHFANVSVSV